MSTSFPRLQQRVEALEATAAALAFDDDEDDEERIPVAELEAAVAKSEREVG